ncbi:MAG: serine/threonine protein kinase, partial [Kangiellaceae bacterium]|nr:serine/threonine protein kinase [Kangiellaceae bacterium]
LNSPKYGSLSGKSTLLGKLNANSLSALSLNEEQSLFYEKALSFNGLAISEPAEIKWSTFQNVQLAFQPQQDSFAQSIVWQNQRNYYPSFVAHSVMQNLTAKASTNKHWSFAINKRIELLLGAKVFPIGINGNIVAKFSRTFDQSYSDFLLKPNRNFSGIFIIDDLSTEQSELISHAIAGLGEDDYLYSNMLTRVAEILFIFLAIIAVFRFSRVSLVFNIILAISFLLFLLVTQYLFLALSFWMPLSLIILTAIISGSIQWAVQKEKRYILENFTPKRKISTAKKKLAADESYDKTLVINTSNSSLNSKPTVNLLELDSFGRYQVNGILGKGAMGVVFQGLDPKINRSVAIKTLQLNDQWDTDSLQETKDRFFREAETAGNLSHANIVTIYDVGEETHPDTDQSLGYIAMDLLTGQPLSAHIKKGKLLPPALVYQLMIQMTDALEYAHNQNVIHRDIKPANIIYDDDLQRGTLTDFGIAHISDHSKTKTGTIIGSPFYMSPEQILGIKIDGRSDVFSLGVTFYQLLSGELPFTGESIASVAFHITKTKHVSVKQHNKKLHSGSTRITNKALQKDKSKRYQTMQEFKLALVNALKRDYKKSPLQ